MQSDVSVAMNNTEERNEDGNLLRDPETGAIMQVEVVTHIKLWNF
jgi:hypothetical protein